MVIKSATPEPVAPRREADELALAPARALERMRGEAEIDDDDDEDNDVRCNALSSHGAHLQMEVDDGEELFLRPRIATCSLSILCPFPSSSHPDRRV